MVRRTYPYLRGICHENDPYQQKMYMILTVLRDDLKYFTVCPVDFQNFVCLEKLQNIIPLLQIFKEKHTLSYRFFLLKNDTLWLATNYF